MSWRIRAEHTSRYRYAGPVYSSYNEARVTPLTTTAQLVLDASVKVEPSTRPYRYLDYWGSVVHAFDIQQPHGELVVTGRSVVETSVPRPGSTAATWSQLDDALLRDDHAEVLAATAWVPADERIAEIAAELRAANDPETAARAAVAWVRDQLSYVSGSTGVHTSAVEAWEGGAGVCQDFAHLALAALRAMGIPARYCSGYLHPNADAGVGMTMEGESHAWVEYWTGDWHAVDPTIGWPIGERHVLVARGRDYGDVAPLKGVFHGGPTGDLQVKVNLTRLG
ncbi:transglutaminase family protein [Acidiferrimicrobium sp. IK]|uniref:transglutaminase family protein n=1 Tax=Acidiferrimicrobium sp. IK TaxID=2871700 RepID=UPI0021CB7135|nr:transglutaminase family protein [Acidiferrimicrobium sp. IK]MCU4183607.1 transglutaminase family protein [Acidiferrimicrobium sp. IK]